MKWLLYIAFIISLSGEAQNLVTNGSFESYTNIDCSTGNISALNNWSYLSSPDYFDSICGANYGVPANMFGHANAANGNSYVGILGFYKPTETKEYVYQHLATPLIAGKPYHLSFYVRRTGRTTYAIQTLGAYASVSQPTLTGYYFPATPQVQNQSGYLTDTTTWTKIEGYFTAVGGEQYITIGNFNSTANSDTLYTGTPNPVPFEPDDAYYYIDSVSLYDSMTVGIDELPASQRFNLYPNPGNGTMQLDYRITEKAELVITDMMGNEVEHLPLEASRTTILLDETRLQAGIYFYSIKSGPALLKQGKLMIIK